MKKNKIIDETIYKCRGCGGAGWVIDQEPVFDEGGWFQERYRDIQVCCPYCGGTGQEEIEEY